MTGMLLAKGDAMKFAWYMLLGLVAGTAAAADKAGEVVFAVGEVSLRQGDTIKPLKRGDILLAGDVLQTGSNGHIHVRMVDQGFVSLRPASRLAIEQYRYNAASSADTAIKFRLEEGVMRSVTGKGGEAAKEKFRLNTPIAAIGIRGTDFSVYTSATETRVSVRSGGVAVSPFNAQCQSQALGACSGQSAANLYAGISDQVLRLRQQDMRPVLLHDPGRQLAPESVAPPLPEEKASQPTVSGAQGEHKVATAPQPSDLLLVDVIGNKTDLLSGSSPVTPPATVARLDWGRWGGSDTASQQGGVPYDIVYQDTANRYALSRSREAINLPERGSFDFKLAASQAEVRQYGAVLAMAQVSDAKLSVDFGRREFNTSLTVSSSALTSPVNLSVTGGGISAEGTLNAHQYYQGNMTLSGALSGDGKEAGYVFSHSLGDTSGRQIIGATQWKR